MFLNFYVVTAYHIQEIVIVLYLQTGVDKILGQIQHFWQTEGSNCWWY